jgi:hypothetical protein
VPVPEENIVVAVDSMGVKVTDRGYGIKKHIVDHKGWIKMKLDTTAL